MVAKVILLACSTTVVIVIVLASIPAVTFNWLGMVQALSYVKLAITIVKYIPQVSGYYLAGSTDYDLITVCNPTACEQPYLSYDQSFVLDG